MHYQMEALVMNLKYALGEWGYRRQFTDSLLVQYTNVERGHRIVFNVIDKSFIAPHRTSTIWLNGAPHTQLTICIKWRLSESESSPEKCIYFLKNDLLYSLIHVSLLQIQLQYIRSVRNILKYTQIWSSLRTFNSKFHLKTSVFWEFLEFEIVFRRVHGTNAFLRKMVASPFKSKKTLNLEKTRFAIWTVAANRIRNSHTLWLSKACTRCVSYSKNSKRPRSESTGSVITNCSNWFNFKISSNSNAVLSVQFEAKIRRYKYLNGIWSLPISCIVDCKPIADPLAVNDCIFLMRAINALCSWKSTL